MVPSESIAMVTDREIHNLYKESSFTITVEAYNEDYNGWIE